MSHDRRFRFGVQTSTASSGEEWASLARQAEDLGYSTMFLPDHFGDQLAPVPAMAAAAAATTELRVGALVFDNDYKHPVVLAKELATLDVLSDGRLEIGIGAGWMITDYEQAGLPYDPPKVRVDRFVEGIRVLKGAFADGPFSFAGEHYTITGYDGLPLPVQRPWPPFLIGGGGPRVLGIAAREADIVGINGNMAPGAVGPEVLATMTAASVDDKIAIVRKAAGDRFDDIELNVRVFMVNVTDTRAATMEALGTAIGYDSDMIEATPFALIGTPAQLVEDLLRRRETWGFSYIIVGQEDVESFAPVVAELAGR